MRARQYMMGSVGMRENTRHAVKEKRGRKLRCWIARLHCSTRKRLRMRNAHFLITRRQDSEQIVLTLIPRQRKQRPLRNTCNGCHLPSVAFIPVRRHVEMNIVQEK